MLRRFLLWLFKQLLLLVVAAFLGATLMHVASGGSLSDVADYLKGVLQ